MKYLFDTCTCIDLIRGNANVLSRLKGCRVGDVGISTITVAELWYGVSKSADVNRNADTLQKFFSSVATISFGKAAAQEYGRLRAGLERAGKPIGAEDMFIAAHAIALGVVLVTSNDREFSKVPGLPIENWRK